MTTPFLDRLGRTVRHILDELDRLARRAIALAAKVIRSLAEVKITPPAVKPEILILGLEMGFTTLFLTGLALATSYTIALMVAGTLGIFALERLDVQRKAGRK